VVTTIVVAYRDRFAGFGTEYVEAALWARGLSVVDPSEVDEDLVRDVTEVLTFLYARRAAAGGAKRAVEAVTGGVL
jgi:predicted site-specific integrase-resolvase